ncbi:MAG: ATP-binding protein [Anaerolineae bacterium]|nr:ATP-binding protein [Anaerolineae bacterium]
MNAQNQTAYTDAPELHPNLILGSLHLFFWLFFHPAAWCNYIIRIDPSLRSDFTLAELTRIRWQIPALRRLLLQIYVVWPLLVGLAVGLTLWKMGASPNTMVVPVAYVMAICLTLNLMIGAVVNLAAGLLSGVLVGLAAGIVATVTRDYVGSIAVPTAISIAIGAASAIGSNLACQRPVVSSGGQTPAIPLKAPGRRVQLGGVVIGVLVGVVAVNLIRIGLTALGGLAIGLTEDTGYNLARTIVVGASFGVALGWRRGIPAGVIGGLVVGLAYATTIIAWKDGWTGLAIGLTSGTLFGTSFGVTVVLPYVLAERMAGPWAGAWAGALGSWGRHVFRNNAPLWPVLPLGVAGICLGMAMVWWRPVALYPLLAAWNLSLYQIDKRRPGHRPSLLRWQSAFWDEFQHLPLTGLDDHLLLVIERNPIEGQAAMEYLSTSRQRWAVQGVQLELEARQLEGYADITALSQAYRQMASSVLTSSKLAGPANGLLRHFSHLSQDIEAALNQTSAYHQRLALNTIGERLNSLVRELTVSSEPYAIRFYPIAARWRQIVTDYGRKLAGVVEQSQEIDNPYIVGVPLTEQQEIFVGRADVVARIEQLLLDRRRPPLLLYGQRRMGKTSLLRNLGRLLPHPIIPLFVDGQKISLASDYPDFLYNIAAEMRKSAEQQRNLNLPLFNRDALAANPFTHFNEWLDEVEQFLTAQGDYTALLALDEFEMLEQVLHKGRFDEADVLSLLRHIIQHRSRFKVMLAGSHTLEEFQRWASYLINVQVVKIGYLERDEARQLVEQPVKNFALRYTPDGCQRVLDLTRGHPALIQLLCYEIVALKNEQPPDQNEATTASGRGLARREDVELAVTRALNSGSFFFADIQQNQVDQPGLALLRFMAAQGESATVSRDELPGFGAADLEPTLAGLLRRDLIEATAGGYRFQVELIRRWFEAGRVNPAE